MRPSRPRLRSPRARPRRPSTSQVHGDTTFELDEVFRLQLSNVAGGSIGIHLGSGTILNDDVTPGLAVTGVSLPEGDTGDTIAALTVAIGSPSAFPITVDVATQDGTATQPSDYDAVTSTLTFAPGETTKTVDVTIHGDASIEPDESFTVHMSNATGASIAVAVGDGTILDDDDHDRPPASTDPVASIGDASIGEGAAGASRTIRFPVSLSRASAGAVTIAYRTSDGSATAGDDYVEGTGRLRIPAGETAGSIDVAITGDDVVEPDETFTLEITSADGARPGSDGIGTIANDDREVTNLDPASQGAPPPRRISRPDASRRAGDEGAGRPAPPDAGRGCSRSSGRRSRCTSSPAAGPRRASSSTRFTASAARPVRGPRDLPRRRDPPPQPRAGPRPHLTPAPDPRVVGSRHDDGTVLDARTPVRYGRALRTAPPDGGTRARRAHPDHARPGHPAPPGHVLRGGPRDHRRLPRRLPDHRGRCGQISGGERIGSFQALVNPEIPIPPFITHLTGIDDRSVAAEPPIEEILPAFLEFCRGAVFVAHNARFDFSFLNTNLTRLDYDPLPAPAVCTARLARRVVWPDVPNVKLLTLARYFRTRVQPNHRAFADAEACAEVLHGLLDLGGRLGILTLGDLHEAVRARGRPHFGKIRLADHLPHAPGVYLFRGRDGRVLYVGKSKDLRARVKSYFYGDERKKIDDLLAETTSIDGVDVRLRARGARRRGAADPPVRAEVQPSRQDVAPLRLPQDRSGRGVPSAEGRAGGRARRRLHVPRTVRVVRRGRSSPKRRSRRSCRSADARTAMSARTRFAPCALADMGRCVAPCDGRVDPERYGELVRRLVSSLTSPGGLLGALERRMAHLAEQERYEEAGLVRDRLRALADALARGRTDAWLVGAGAAQRARRRPDRRSGSTTERWCAATMPNRSPCPARANAPTSWRRCAAGSARTARGRVLRPLARRARRRRCRDRPHPGTGEEAAGEGRT